MSRIEKQKSIWSCVIGAVFILLLFSFPAAGALKAPQANDTMVPATPHLFAPTNLKVLAIPNSLSLRLEWQDTSTGETGFEIESIGNGPVSTKTVPADVTQYKDLIEADHTVVYRVRAIAGSSYSPWSDSVKWTSYPIGPTNLTANLSITQSNYVDLSWKNNSKVNPSFILLKANASNVLIKSIKIPAGQTSYQDKEVADNSSYGYAVIAETVGGTSAQSNKVTVTILARPTDLTLSCFPGTFAPQLKWKDTSYGETGFIVERAVEGQKSNFDAFNVPANTTQYNDTVKPDTKYYYQVRAVCADGASANSNCVVWSSAPTEPANPQVYASASSYVKLTWQDTSQTETQFLISRASTKEVAMLKAPANSTSYIDTAVTPGITYKYSVAANNENSKTMSGFTKPVAVTTLVAPTDLKAKAGLNAVTLEWEGTLPAGCYYEVRRKIGSGMFSNLAGSGGPLYIDKQVNPGTQYTYQVRVKTTNAMSNYTNDVTVTTPYQANTGKTINQPVTKVPLIKNPNMH